MILEMFPSEMAFDVSKYPFCNIKKWTIGWQTEVDVSNIFESLLYFTRFIIWECMVCEQSVGCTWLYLRGQLGMAIENNLQRK